MKSLLCCCNQSLSGLGDPACCRPPELFACPLCRRLLCEPVTLHCGHTHCRRCPSSAASAAAASPPSPAARPRVNVVLGNLLQKWFAAESRARRLRAEGDALRERQELPAALEKYNEALEMGEPPGRVPPAKGWGGLGERRSFGTKFWE
uniref:RING-type domain-containing protein n=1 Tax=Anser brachyrhynchus TaxID=132585 RepID=A0A8B9C0S8_9AVES